MHIHPYFSPCKILIILELVLLMLLPIADVCTFKNEMEGNIISFWTTLIFILKYDLWYIVDLCLITGVSWKRVCNSSQIIRMVILGRWYYDKLSFFFENVIANQIVDYLETNDINEDCVHIIALAHHSTNTS